MATKLNTAQLLKAATKSKPFAIANRKALLRATSAKVPSKGQIAAAAQVFNLKPTSNRAVAAAMWCNGGATQAQVLAVTGYVQRNTYKTLAGNGHKVATASNGVITLRPGGKGQGGALTVLAKATPASAPKANVPAAQAAA